MIHKIISSPIKCCVLACRSNYVGEITQVCVQSAGLTLLVNIADTNAVNRRVYKEICEPDTQTQFLVLSLLASSCFYFMAVYLSKCN